MAAVITANVIVPFEVAVVFARVPVARRLRVVDQAAIVQHRQIEAAAVPRHELGRVFLDALVEALDQLALALAADRPHLETVAVPQCAGDNDDPVQVQRQEVRPAGLPAQLERHVRDAFVGNCRVEPVEAAQPLDIGNRLDIKG